MLQSAIIAALAANVATATPIENTISVSQPETAARNFTIQQSSCYNFVNGAADGNCRWCADYLRDLGSTACVVDRRSGYPPKFCAHGSDPNKCYVYGVLPDGVDSTRSACSDVASAAYYVIDHCTSFGFTNGWAVANGNGNIHVEVHG